MTERELTLLEMLPSCERIAREAGGIALSGYRRGTPISKKGALDLVTEYDLASEAHILRELGLLFPEIAVIAEESHQHARAVNEDELTFYVDPIDGTMNFAHGHPFFCVSIGLCRGGVPLLGVVHAPALSITWTCAGPGTAQRNGEACRVAERKDVIDFLCATGFPQDRATNPDNNYREFAFIKDRVRGIRRCGSAAIDLALVADGTYDVYWEQRLKPWDMAAGAALVLAASGRLRGYAGGEADVRSGSLIAASSAAFVPFAEMFDAVRSTVTS